LPSLQRAKDKAKEAACVNNLRQLHTVFVMDAEENNGLLLQAWYIYERFWYTWNTPEFYHQKLKSYLSPRSAVYLDPGWPKDKSYQNPLSPPAYVQGTPDDWTATPALWTSANTGGSYYYSWRPFSQVYAPEDWPRFSLKGPKRSDRAILLRCYPPQQANNPVELSLGLVGPHGAGTAWNAVFLDGHVDRLIGVPFPNGWLYVNVAADWTW
jgi:prepilin-type processing-associated H-X9-DG protein